MVIVTMDMKHAFEQWLRAISLDINPSPSDRAPAALSGPEQRSSFEDLVLMSCDGLFAMYISMLVQVSYVSVVGQDVVVGLQLEFYPLIATVESKGEIEFGEIVDEMRRGLDDGMVDGRHMFDGTGSLRSG